MVSIVLYIMLAATSAALTHTAQKRNDKRLLMAAVVLLTLVVGLRAPEVGEDTTRNIWVFNRCLEVGPSFIKRDHLYYYLGVALMFVFRTAYAPLIATAFFTFFLMLYRLWDFRHCGNLGIAVWILVLYYLGYTMNGSRQLLSVAIVFYFSRYLEKKNFKAYLLGAVLASLIHISSVVVVVLPVFYIGLKKQYDTVERLYLIGTAVGTLAMAVLLAVVYSGYLSSAGTMRIGAMTVVRLLMIIAAYVIWCLTGAWDTTPRSAETNKLFNLLFAITLFGCLLSFAGVLIDSAGRMGYFFRFFETVLFAVLFQKKASTTVGSVLQGGLLMAVSVIGFYYLYRYNNILPYHCVFF